MRIMRHISDVTGDDYNSQRRGGADKAGSENMTQI